MEVSAPQVDGLRPLLDSRIQKQSVEDVEVLPRVRRVRFEEQSVDLPDPPIVEEIVDVVQITPQERFRQGTVEQVFVAPVPQIVEETSERVRLRTVEQIAHVPVPQIQELLLDSIATLDRLQTSAA